MFYDQSETLSCDTDKVITSWVHRNRYSLDTSVFYCSLKDSGAASASLTSAGVVYSISTCSASASAVPPSVVSVFVASTSVESAASVSASAVGTDSFV